MGYCLFNGGTQLQEGLCRENSMVVDVKLVETKCATCGSPIYVYEEFVREKMYCTLHCMVSAGSGETVGRERLEVLAS